jgi:hypothetical protein
MPSSFIQSFIHPWLQVLASTGCAPLTTCWAPCMHMSAYGLPTAWITPVAWWCWLQVYDCDWLCSTAGTRQMRSLIDNDKHLLCCWPQVYDYDRLCPTDDLLHTVLLPVTHAGVKVRTHHA